MKVLKILVYIILIVIIAAAIYALVNADYTSIGSTITEKFNSAVDSISEWVTDIVSGAASENG